TTTNNNDNNINNKKVLNYDIKVDDDDDDGFVYFNGEYFLIRNAKLYSPPTTHHIPIFMAAAGSESAKASAKYCDGLITFLKAKEAQKVLDIFDRAVKKAGEGEDTNNNNKIMN